MTFQQLLDLADRLASSPASVALLLILILWAGLAGKWVWGWVFENEVSRRQEADEDRLEWQDIALSALNDAERTASAAEIAMLARRRRRRRAGRGRES